MSPAERILRAIAEKFAAITALTDAFCEKQLNDEYRVLIHRVVGSLARKRPSPLLKGPEESDKFVVMAALNLVGCIAFVPLPRRRNRARRSQ